MLIFIFLNPGILKAWNEILEALNTEILEPEILEPRHPEILKS